jgi:hypothetical protein
LSVGEDFAVFGRDHVSDLIFVGIQELKKTKHHSRSSNGRQFGPSHLSVLGCKNGGIHIASISKNDFLAHVSAGGVIDGLLTRVGSGLSVSVDEVLNQGQRVGVTRHGEILLSITGSYRNLKPWARVV